MGNGSWRISRSRGRAHLPLAVVAVLAVALILFGKAQSSLFDRARTYFSDATAPMLEAARGPVNGFGHWVGGLGQIFVVYSENQKLKEENAKLRQWQNAALVLEQRLKRYQLLLNAVQDPSLSSVTAHVIGRANRPFLDTMILDAGKIQGVKPGEAVVDDRGMIGRIYLVGQHTAWVVLLTDLSSRIPVSVEPGHIQAILSGDNSTSPGLETQRPGIVLKVGQQIVTSGDGGLLPAGLPVGTVTWNGSEFRATLLADATEADDVRILDLKQPPEQPPTPGTNDLPVVAGGIQPLAQAPNTSPNTQVKPLQLPAGVPPPLSPAQIQQLQEQKAAGVKPGAAQAAAAPSQDEDDH